MKLHLIYNPNSKGAEVRVHRAGCRDIDRELKGHRHTSDYVADFDSKQDAAEDFWADFIEEDSMTAADAMTYTEFLPCVGDLPERAGAPDLLAATVLELARAGQADAPAGYVLRYAKADYDLLHRVEGTGPRWLVRCVEHGTTAPAEGGKAARVALGNDRAAWCAACRAA